MDLKGQLLGSRSNLTCTPLVLGLLPSAESVSTVLSSGSSGHTALAEHGGSRVLETTLGSVFLPRVSTIPKWNSFNPWVVLDLRCLNRIIKPFQFCMLTVPQVCLTLRPGTQFTILALKSTCCHPNFSKITAISGISMGELCLPVHNASTYHQHCSQNLHLDDEESGPGTFLPWSSRTHVSQ